ncbi:MAG TPA: GTP cyclohydrolase, FolE2/MptA family [candidate division Zixibacteria bacterium]|jgi:GTP cyclohydrolase I
MAEEKRFLVDVGIRDLPFPMRVASKVNPEGQQTIANISISARIIREFEARWIDKFIQIIHQHRDRIGTKTLQGNILDYLNQLQAKTVKIDFNYPFFVEKPTPVSKAKCLVRYLCTFSAKASYVVDKPKIIFKMEIPIITTFPGSTPEKPGGLFGQLSIVAVEIESQKEIYPEDIVEIVDKHALVPVYSFLTEEDQAFVIQKIHTENKTSVVVTDKIRDELSRVKDIVWYSVRCFNYGMLHSYSTVIGTEKGLWFPTSGYEEEEI